MSIEPPPTPSQCEVCHRWREHVSYSFGLRCNACDVCLRVMSAKLRAEAKQQAQAARRLLVPAVCTAVAATFGGAGAAVAYWALRAAW